MIDNAFTIKEASRIVDCTTQNIYRQKSELISKGYMEQDKSGAYYINENGINYLRDKRAESIRSSSQVFNQVDNKDLSSVANPTNASNTEYIQVLKEQIQDLKNERDYWKERYIQKDDELKNKNDYIQSVNTQVFAFLNTTEGNKQTEEKIKKGFFARLFS